MRLVRIVGEYKEGGEPIGSRAVILCGVDNNGRLVDGEWFGYDRYDDGVEQPFVLRFGELFDFGGDPKEVQRTNIGQRALRVGEYFTVSSEHGGPEGWAVACLITHVTEVGFATSAITHEPIAKPSAAVGERRVANRVHVASAKEIDQLRARQAKVEKEARAKARLASIAAKYEKKSNKGMKKDQKQSKKAKEDILVRGSRLPGSAFSKKR